MSEAMKERITAMIAADHRRLLRDFDMDDALYQHDPESGEAAVALANAVISVISADLLTAAEAERDAALAQVDRLKAALLNAIMETEGCVNLYFILPGQPCVCRRRAACAEDAKP